MKTRPKISFTILYLIEKTDKPEFRIVSVPEELVI